MESLGDMVFGRPHELKGDRAGQVSVDLVHPLRLIFRPTVQPPPVNPWVRRVEAIMFGTMGGGPSPWEALLPPELLRLPAELGRVDA